MVEYLNSKIQEFRQSFFPHTNRNYLETFIVFSYVVNRESIDRYILFKKFGDDNI